MLAKIFCSDKYDKKNRIQSLPKNPQHKSSILILILSGTAASHVTNIPLQNNAPLKMGDKTVIRWSTGEKTWTRICSIRYNSTLLCLEFSSLRVRTTSQAQKCFQQLISNWLAIQEFCKCIWILTVSYCEWSTDYYNGRRFRGDEMLMKLEKNTGSDDSFTELLSTQERAEGGLCFS